MNIAETRSFCVELLQRTGVPEDEAAITVDSLIHADLKKVSSHGLNRLPVYIKRIKANLVRAKAEMIVERDAAAIAVIDAQYSIAQVIATRAMELAIGKARSYGIGAVLVKNSGHFGMAATYGLQAAREKMIGIVTSNVTPLMPAPGGASRVIGNNPLAIVAPTKSDPITPDMAMSTVALGKLIVAKNAGMKIPLDWAVDKFGKVTDDPEAGIAGMMLPMASHKGYALAIGLEILTGVMAGCFAWNISGLYDLSKRQSIAHMLIAINIASFVDLDEYYEQIESLRSGLKNSKRAEGFAEIFLPGEIELRNLNSATSISLPESVLKELNGLARESGMAPLSQEVAISK